METHVLGSTKFSKISEISQFFEKIVKPKTWVSIDRIKKFQKTDPPISRHFLPNTEPDFSFDLYLVWFGKLKIQKVPKWGLGPKILMGTF